MDDLTKSTNAGVRWQAQMEEHLSSVRGFTNEAVRIASSNPEGAAVRASLANANAIAALTLALGNAGSDFEMAMGSLGEKIAGAIEGP